MIKDNLKKIQKTIYSTSQKYNLNNTVTNVIVTKYADISEIKQVVQEGYLLLAENRIQVAEKKILSLQNLGIKWHFIGHLQTNKANKAVQLFDCIQSVDSIRLLTVLSEVCQ